MTQFNFQQPPPGACSFCGRPLPLNHYTVNGRPACDVCMQRVAQMVELNEFSPGAWTLGLVYGLAAAVLCGVGWALIVKIINAEIGIIAIGIGIVVTKAILAGANGRRGPSIQTIAVICSLLGIYIGKGLIVSWVLWDQLRAHGVVSNDSLSLRAVYFFLSPIVGFQFFDLIWYAIAAWEAWRLTRAIPLRIDGPRAVPPPMVNGEIIGGSYQSPHQSATQSPQSTAPAPQPPQPRSTPLAKAFLITLVSAAISVVVYQTEFGWAFAVGFVLCILIHEMGHTIACLAYGLPASSPIFIPYVGAVISLRAQPPDAKVESIIGIAGPWGGLLATALCYAWYRTTHSQMAATLVQFGAMMNLFNLLPIHPLDGGRIARGVASGFWGIFLAAFAVFCWLAPRIDIRQGVAILCGVITIVGIARTLRVKKGSYYAISETSAWLIGFAYLGTGAALLVLWALVRNVGMIF